MQIRSRQAVRALLLTPQQQILMLRLKTERYTFWIAPGGGMNPGETEHQALRRELMEETGLSDVRIGPCVWTRQTTYTLGPSDTPEVEVHQSERFYLVPSPQFEPSAHNMPDETERDWFQGFRWLTVCDIRQLPEAVAPSQLASELDRLIALGPPSLPLAIAR
jgi:8-oxo-dGTP pyrophosphatase MutT (NUDIX family)